MSIILNPVLEKQLLERAEARGITVNEYLDGLVQAEQRAENELEQLALEGLASGPPVEAGPEFWNRLHQRLDERLNQR
ncbi:MAG: hypothetical protein IT168_14865 [Bryobacterales bacterium]|nr:hypothetical protein [Bryobacterales bacterium]